MVLSLAHGADVKDWPPEKMVYVPFGYFADLGEGEELPADVAYSNQRSASTHFWFKDKGIRARVVEMSVREFVHRMAVERDSNPFAEVTKREFIQMWRERYL